MIAAARTGLVAVEKGMTAEPRAIFGPIAGMYERPAALLSLGQYGRWRRALVRRLDLPAGARVLDVATGTGLVARDIERSYECAVVGLDLSIPMLAESRRRSACALVCGDAKSLPFGEGTYDAVVFSYLLRYVGDPGSTLHELARVLRPGGVLAGVEFGAPRVPLARLGWRAYSFGLFPTVARGLGAGWRTLGTFLPRSILEWSKDWPTGRQVAAWESAGVVDVQTRELTWGAGVVMCGRKHE
jgi:demethylmenaquinone methyltransferase/2-methoxy-6-polyprenyl-1,4-benzoquinol methylase